MMKRIIKKALIIGFITILIIFLFIRFGGYIFIDSEIKKELIVSIKASPQLPDKFYKLFEIAYPKSLSRDYMTFTLDHKLLENQGSVPPSHQTSYLGSYFWGIKLYMLIFYVEDWTTQQECLNYLSESHDFLNGNRGIRQASLFYFKKEVDDLDDKQMVTFILMLENPSFYNPIRRPEFVNEKAEEVLKQLAELESK